MTLFTITSPFLWAFYWLLKSTFLGGWVFARWLAWLLSPIWVTTAVIGAVSGFFTGK